MFLILIHFYHFSYELVSYDPNYPDYLKALGIPSFILTLILQMSEIITISAKEDPAEKWKMEKKTGNYAGGLCIN